MGLEGPDQPDLVEPQPQRLGGMAVEAKIVERLAEVEIGLSGGADAEARARRIEDHPVHRIGAGESRHRRHLRAVKARLLRQRRVRPADAQAARRQREIAGQGDRHAMRIGFDRGRAFDGFGDRLHADPAAGVTRQREAEQTEIEIVLHAGRVKERHHRGAKDVFALMGIGGGLRSHDRRRRSPARRHRARCRRHWHA